MQPAENPFAAPRAGAVHAPEVSGPRRVLRWRIIPTVLLGSLGVLIATIGVALFGMVLVWIGEDVLSPDAAGRRVEHLLSTLFELAFCLITTGTGALWIWSAALFWRQRWRGAVVTGLLGAIPVGLFLAL